MNSSSLLQSLKNSVLFLIALTIITGLVYPLVVTTIAQLAFSKQALGSLITFEDRIVGTAQIGQQFSTPKYFWGRLSATTPYPYNAAASSGSNLGPSNEKLIANVRDRIDRLQAAANGSLNEIPVDLVTASGSGLDPDISPNAAKFQIERVAKARNLSTDTVARLVEQHIQTPQFGLLGEPRVNVLQLNLALDQLQP